MRWGPALLFPLAPAQSVLPALSGALGGLPDSLLCLPPSSSSSSFHGSLWFWRGASATFHAGPTLGLSSAPWLFHRILHPVSSVLPLLDSSLLGSLACWLVWGSAFQVLLETGPSSSAGVVSSASSSCLRGPLGCLLLLSTRGLPLVSVSLPVFEALRQVLLFSLVLQAFLSVSLLLVSVWRCFLGLLSFRLAVVPGSLIPLRCLPFRRLVPGPVWSQGFLYLSTLVFSTLRWCSAFSLLFIGLLLVMVQPVLFLFSVSSVRSWGRCSLHLPPFFRLLVSSRLALSVCRRVLWASLFCW